MASKCGFTGQYKGLQEMYEKFKEDGLEILACVACRVSDHTPRCFAAELRLPPRCRFPCNQFGKQEPGSNAEYVQGHAACPNCTACTSLPPCVTLRRIQEFACERFKTTFPILGKVEVNGAGAAPLYKVSHASSSLGLPQPLHPLSPPPPFPLGQYLKKAKQGKVSNDVWWNFEKFLVVDGKPIERYVSTTTPASIEKDIEKALGKTSK